MDDEMLAWLSCQELKEIQDEDIIEALSGKLVTIERENITFVQNTQTQTELLISGIDEADELLARLQDLIQLELNKIRLLREKTKDIEDKNIQLNIEQHNRQQLIEVLESHINSMPTSK